MQQEGLYRLQQYVLMTLGGILMVALQKIYICDISNCRQSGMSVEVPNKVR